MDENNQQPVAPVVPPVVPVEPKKSKKGLIIGLIVGGFVLFLLLGGLVVGILLMAVQNDNDSNNDFSTSQLTEEYESDPSMNAETVKYLTEFDVVCKNGSVTNAATYAAPYKVAAFSYNNAQVGESWDSVSLPYDATYAADNDKIEEVNVVACLKEQDDAAVKVKTCEFKSGAEMVTLDYYATKYDLTFYEAKTGAKIEDGATINGPATDCPTFVSYNKADPKLHADPDKNAVDAAIKAFVQ